MVESKMTIIIDKISKAKDNFVLVREELEVIKKYIAIQRYRNPGNQSYYTESYKGDKLSRYSIKENEEETDFWKREMLFILENDWDTIINQKELIGVKLVTDQIYSEYLTFFVTEQEFVISDINCFTERVNIVIPEDKKNDYYNMSVEVRKRMGFFDAEEGAIKELTRDKNYFDNFTFIVLSPNLAVASVNPIWKYKYMNPEINDDWMIKKIFSPIMGNQKNFTCPITNYVNKDNIKTISDIVKYKSSLDEYTYKKILLNESETNHLMLLCLNEAKQYLAYKNSEHIKKYIRLYNTLSNKNIDNIKNNYSGFISLIDALK